jgi:hypothetical protein
MALVARPISSNILINDLPPPVANLLEEATIQSLRGVQHRDSNGNVISKSCPYSSPSEQVMRLTV